MTEMVMTVTTEETTEETLAVTKVRSMASAWKRPNAYVSGGFGGGDGGFGGGDKSFHFSCNYKAS
jgi:hypothetical protein